MFVDGRGPWYFCTIPAGGGEAGRAAAPEPEPGRGHPLNFILVKAAARPSAA